MLTHQFSTKNFFFSVIFVVILGLFFTPVKASAANLFSDGFESGNLSAWSSATTDSGDLSAAAGAKIHGLYGLSNLIDDTNAFFVNNGTPNGEKIYRVRFYLDPNTLSMGNNTSVIIFQAYNSAWGSAYFIGLQYLSSAYKIYYRVDTDTGTTYSSSYTITDAPHHIEVNWAAATAAGANNGFITLYIDGASKETTSNIDNDTRVVDQVLLGAISVQAGISGTYYLDDFASNNDGSLIGDAPPTAATPAALAQYKSNGSTVIASGTITNESTVVFKFNMSSANNPDTLTPQIEIQQIGTSFTNSATHTGNPVAYSGTPVEGVVTATGLTSEKTYHWQASVSNSDGNSAWTQKGGNPDFGSDTTAPVLGYIKYTGGSFTQSSVSLTVNDGTDNGSGINTSSRIIQRKSATLTNGSCGSYSSWSTITPTGAYPNFTDTTISDAKCYQYQYLVSDNLNHQATYTALDLGIGLFSTPDTSLFDGYVDTLLANAFTKLRVDIPDYQNSTWLTRSKAAVIRAIAKGASIIWGVSSNGFNNPSYMITAENWPTFRQAILDNAQWAQDNGVYEFQLGNEEEFHLDWTPVSVIRSGNVTTVTTPVNHNFTEVNPINIYGCTTSSFNNGTSAITVTGPTTFTYANAGADGSTTGCKVRSMNEDTLRSNLKTLATDVQSVFTRGNVSYTVGFGAGSYQLDKWLALGRGDIDLLAFNAYSNTTGVLTNMANALSAFGADHTYLTEFNLDSASLDAYSTDEAVQATGLTSYITSIKNAGFSRAHYFAFIDDAFGAKKGNGTYRQLWNVLQSNINTVKVTLPASAAVTGPDSSPPSSSSPQAPGCGNSPPGSAPWLYAAIAKDANSVLIYFTDANDPIDHYTLKFGSSANDYRFGAANIGGKGIRTYLVNYLQPDTTYYFKVMGGNGCATGPWSNELSARTLNSSVTNQLKTTNIELEPVATISKPASSLPNPSTTPTSQVSTSIPTGYSVNIKVKDTNQKPVTGAKVTIHSTVREALTDTNGIARFDNIEPGDHRVLVAYQGFEGQQSINLKGDVAEFNLNITVAPTGSTPSPATGNQLTRTVIILALILALPLIFITILLVKAIRKA